VSGAQQNLLSLSLSLSLLLLSFSALCLALLSLGLHAKWKTGEGNNFGRFFVFVIKYNSALPLKKMLDNKVLRVSTSHAIATYGRTTESKRKSKKKRKKKQKKKQKKERERERERGREREEKGRERRREKREAYVSAQFLQRHNRGVL